MKLARGPRLFPRSAPSSTRARLYPAPSSSLLYRPASDKQKLGFALHTYHATFVFGPLLFTLGAFGRQFGAPQPRSSSGTFVQQRSHGKQDIFLTKLRGRGENIVLRVYTFYPELGIPFLDTECAKQHSNVIVPEIPPWSLRAHTRLSTFS
jgi:hypothetical protein